MEDKEKEEIRNQIELNKIKKDLQKTNAPIGNVSVSKYILFYIMLGILLVFCYFVNLYFNG